MHDTVDTQPLNHLPAIGPQRLARFLFALAVPLFLALLTGPSFAQASSLKAIRLTSAMPGIPITVNGVVHVTPATINVNPNEPLTVSAPTLFDRGDGFRFRPRHWQIQYSTSRPQDIFENTASIQLADARETSAIFFNAWVEIRIAVTVSGPGSVVWDPPAQADGFIPIGSSLRLNAVPHQNAFFAGWDPPWDYAESSLWLNVITVPLSLTVHFGERMTPPPALSTSGSFPDLRMRSSDALLEGQITVQAPVPVRVRGFDIPCQPQNLFIYASLSQRVTPFEVRARLGAENNSAPEGLYTCAIVLDRYDGAAPFSIPFRVRIGEEEPATPPAVSVNGASFEKMPLAPGAIFSLFGANIGLATAHATSLPLPTALGGVRVRIRSGSSNYEAPLFYVSPGQLNFLAPLGLPSGAGTLEILRDGASGISIPIVAELQAPALFTANSTGSGPPAGYYVRVRGEQQQRGELVDCPQGKDCVPAPIQSPDPAEEVYLVLFGTGFRNVPSIKPQVRMGDMVEEASYFGAHRDFAGLDQINVRVPRALLGQGRKAVTVTHGSRQSNTVTITF